MDATLCPAFVQKVRGRASLGYSLSYDLSYVKTTSNTRERLVHLGKESLEEENGRVGGPRLEPEAALLADATLCIRNTTIKR